MIVPDDDDDGAPAPGPIDPGLQAERTSLAWERTAIAVMVAGVLLARYEADDLPAAAAVGLAATVAGAALLVWSGVQPDDPRPAGPEGTAAKLAMVRVLGLGTVTFLAAAVVLTLAIAFTA